MVHALYRDLRAAGVPINLWLGSFIDLLCGSPLDWGLVQQYPDPALGPIFLERLHITAFIHLIDGLTIDYSDMLCESEEGEVREMRSYGADYGIGPVSEIPGDLVLNETIEFEIKRANRIWSYFFRYYGAPMTT